MTDQQNDVEEAPQTGPTKVGGRVLSHTTLITAIVVLAAIALIIILLKR